MKLELIDYLSAADRPKSKASTVEEEQEGERSRLTSCLFLP